MLLKNLSFRYSERFHCGSGTLCSGAGCGICGRYHDLWRRADEWGRSESEQESLQRQARAIKPVERFHYVSDGGKLTVGKTLHEEFQDKGRNVRVTFNLVYSDRETYPYYHVERV